jgi:hypothetical protein
MFPVKKPLGLKNVRKYLNKKIEKAVSMWTILEKKLLNEGIKQKIENKP